MASTSMTLTEEDQEIIWRLAAAILTREGGSVEDAVATATANIDAILAKP